MEKPLSEDILRAVQELEEEHGTPESPPQVVEELLRALQSGGQLYARRDAVEQLARLGRSSHRIVRALIAACYSDSPTTVTAAAARALRAPVHQQYLDQHLDLREVTERALRQAPGAGPVTRPPHFREETKGDTLHISWKPGLRQRLAGAMWPLLFLVASVLWLLVCLRLPGVLPFPWVFVSLAAAFGSLYWIVAILANATTILAGTEEWVFQRGPLPLPVRRFYLRPRQLDLAACRWVYTARVEEYKRRSYGGGGGTADSPLGCLLEQALSAVIVGIAERVTDRELIVTYMLCAQGLDGSDQELLGLLSEEEARYLGQTLQRRFDARVGAQAEQ